MQPSTLAGDAMYRICATILILLASLANLNAASFTNRGAGIASCGSWTQEHRDKTTSALLQDNWILGFVVAIEIQSGKKYYSSPDYAALIAWVSNYCTASPLSDLADAALRLTRELQNDPADAVNKKRR